MGLQAAVSCSSLEIRFCFPVDSCWARRDEKAFEFGDRQNTFLNWRRLTAKCLKTQAIGCELVYLSHSSSDRSKNFRHLLSILLRIYWHQVEFASFESQKLIEELLIQNGNLD